MNIEYVKMNVTLKGVSNQWEEGEVIHPPLPSEILEEIRLNRGTVTPFFNGDPNLTPPQEVNLVSEIKTSSPVRVKRVKR